ncbi:hypothetical protein OSTOST_10606 [Ostertagia ostertagi]
MTEEDLSVDSSCRVGEIRVFQSGSKFSALSGSSQTLSQSNSTSPPRFRATPYAAESKTATREEAVLLRSLLALIGKHCPSEFDKYQVLEERDKLLSRLRDVSHIHNVH